MNRTMMIAMLMIRLRGVLAALAAVLALGAVTLPARAETAPTFTPEQKIAIEQMVKDYIMAHPEVVQDALLELDKRQKETENAAVKTAVKTEAKAIYDTNAGTVVGNPKGDVTLVEFFDYNCPYCRKSMTTLDALLKSDPKLRIVLRDLPIVHPPESIEVAKIAMAAKNQLSSDKFWDFHKKLFSASRIIAKPQALQVAKEAGLDMARLDKDAESDAVKAALVDSDRLSQILNLRGTPAFVLGEDVVFGALEDDEMKAQIAAVRQCGRTTC
ncbi:Protein-disulfide isomerase [Rhizobiales bacterium GAS188]|nr:Protein-disulfide isomerase [Rhizobiales bacterium GAS188]